MKRIVEEDAIGFVEMESFLNFVLSAALSTISELFVVEVKHDFCKTLNPKPLY